MRRFFRRVVSEMGWHGRGLLLVCLALLTDLIVLDRSVDASSTCSYLSVRLVWMAGWMDGWNLIKVGLV